MIRKRTFGLRLALLVLLPVVAALPACAPDPEAPADDVLDRAIGQEPDALDPQRARTTQAFAVLHDLFEGLVTYTVDGDIEGGSAERWEISDDGLTYRFMLRDGLRWSNGDPLTSEAFVFSLRRLFDPATAAPQPDTLAAVRNAAPILGGELDPDKLGVSAPDPRTVVIELGRPVPHLLELLTLPIAFPVHAASIKEHGERFARPGNLVSNGAYRLDDWVLGSVIELSRNEHYRANADTAIDRVRHHVIEQPAAELNRYRARTGSLDITSTIPTGGFDEMMETRPDEVKTAPTISTFYLGLNLDYAVLGEGDMLREALSLAVDRERLVSDVIGRGEAATYRVVPPGIRNYDGPEPPMEAMTQAARIAEAKRLYAAAGYGPEHSPSIELRYHNSETNRVIALAIRDMWRQAFSFEAALLNEEFRAFVANVQAKDITQAFRFRWTGDYNDATAFLDMFMSDSPSNYYGYADDEYDDQMERAAATADPESRRLYLEEAERVLLANHVVIPLYTPLSKHLVKPHICGWQDNLLDYHFSRHLRFCDP